jgi:dTDP-glucose 4,6-dehydratase
LPAVILRCTNNYGPYQFPEKLFPLAIANALEDKPIPVYGDGLYERDWLYVEDCCRAIEGVLDRGSPGEIYNVSSGMTQPNLKAVQKVLELLGKPSSLIRHVEDRPGHDRRYSLDSRKIRSTIGWEPQVIFEEGVRRTIEWYRANSAWLEQARSGKYREYYERHYLRRAQTLKGIQT